MVFLVRLSAGYFNGVHEFLKTKRGLHYTGDSNGKVNILESDSMVNF